MKLHVFVFLYQYLQVVCISFVVTCFLQYLLHFLRNGVALYGAVFHPYPAATECALLVVGCPISGDNGIAACAYAECGIVELHHIGVVAGGASSAFVEEGELPRMAQEYVGQVVAVVTRCEQRGQCK